MILMGIPNVDVELATNFDVFTNLFCLMRMVDDPAAEYTCRTIRRLKCYRRIGPLLPLGNNRLRYNLT